MKLNIDVNLRFMAITGTFVIVGAVLWFAACFLFSAHRQRKEAETAAIYTAHEKEKAKYISDHRFDSLIKEQQWIMSHPDDPRLKDAPHGKQLLDELNGVYNGLHLFKDDDVSSSQLKAFTGRDKDYSLSEKDEGSSIAQQMVQDGSLPDMGDKPYEIKPSGLDGYYLVLENKALMKSLVNIAGGEADAKKIAQSLGYIYSLKSEDSRKNVLRAIRFANIFSPYSEILSSYAHTGEDPSMKKLASSPF